MYLLVPLITNIRLTLFVPFPFTVIHREIRLRVLSKQQQQQTADGSSSRSNNEDEDSASTIKYKKLAAAIERQLFRSATTIQSYADVSTLDTRLRSLLMSKLLQRQLASNKNTTTTTTNTTSTTATTNDDSSSSSSSSSEQSYHQHQENLRAQVLLKTMGLQRYNTFKQVIREIRHERHLYGSKLGCAQCVGNSCPPSPVRSPTPNSSSVSPIDACYQSLSSSLPPPMMNFKDDTMPSEVKDLFFESTNVLIDAFERWPIERIAKMDNTLEWDVLLARGKQSLIKYHAWKNDTRIRSKNVVPQEEEQSIVAIEEDAHHDDDGVDDEDLLL